MDQTAKRKAETIKEVREMEERKQLVNYLICKWQEADNTVYYKEARLYKLIEMINEITFYLYDESSKLSRNEQYILLSLIRAISAIIDEKTLSNKEALEQLLRNLEELSAGA